MHGGDWARGPLFDHPAEGLNSLGLAYVRMVERSDDPAGKWSRKKRPMRMFRT